MATPRWGGLRLEPYNPDAVDADGDGIVQEGTAWERPAATRLVTSLGIEVGRGLTATERPTLRVVDASGRTVQYTPTYQRSQGGISPAFKGKLSTLGELGYPSLKERGIKTIGELGYPTVGEIVRPRPAQTVDVADVVYNIGRALEQDLRIPKRGNRNRAFNRADSKANELAFTRGTHYVLETDSEFLVLTPNQLDEFMLAIGNRLPDDYQVSKYERPKAGQDDQDQLKADLTGPKELDINDQDYRDAVIDIHENSGDITTLNDELFIAAMLDENLVFDGGGGEDLLNDDGSPATFEDIMTGRLTMQTNDYFTNKRFMFEQLKSDFFMDEQFGGVWSVFRVEDKETGDIWYVKGSTYAAHDAMLEDIGLRTAQLLDLAAYPSMNDLRISPTATVREHGERKIRWVAMRNVDEWSHPGGAGISWQVANDVGGIDTARVNVSDVSQIVTMDFILGNSDRHTGNFMVGEDQDGMVRLMVIDNGILAGGRFYDQKGDHNTEVTAAEIREALRAEEEMSASEVLNSPIGTQLINNIDVKNLAPRLGDVDGEGGEFIAASERTVKSIKANLDRLFSIDQFSRRGVPLSSTEIAHLEGLKNVAMKRIEMLESQPDLLWYQIFYYPPSPVGLV